MANRGHEQDHHRQNAYNRAELTHIPAPTGSIRRRPFEELNNSGRRIVHWAYLNLPLADVLRNRRGVCQDYAHVMIGALRSLRLAARYVSGYVRSGSKVQGAQASHAWVSVFVPGSGWVHFDPTNDVMPSDSHLTLAWGRDYGDVSPVKGVTLGGGGQTVAVEVYVMAV